MKPFSFTWFKKSTLAGLALVAAVGLTVTTTGCASTRTAGEQIDDAGITAKIKTKYAADPEINPFNIDVDTDNRVVRLRGTVEDEATRREAIELAESTEGVRRVISDIRIGERTMGDRLDDATIVTAVNAKFAADPMVSALKIDVDSNDGVVTLSGTVKTEQVRRHAADLVRTVDGVRSVENRLKVEPANS